MAPAVSNRPNGRRRMLHTSTIAEAAASVRSAAGTTRLAREPPRAAMFTSG